MTRLKIPAGYFRSVAKDANARPPIREDNGHAVPKQDI